MNVFQAEGYQVHIGGEEVFKTINSFLKDQYLDRKKVILVDENTHQYCYPQLIQSLPDIGEFEMIEIPSGEENKTIEICSQLWSALNDFGLDRKSLFINLGGGVIGDMGGFVASTFKRGIDFINIPTTLLSQVDSSVGGKLGVDLEKGKNLVGLFQNPKAVFINTEFLSTLEANQVKSGFAEVIKHGLIADESYFEKLKKTDPADFDWAEIVNRSVEIKGNVVAEDPMEAGLRKNLNFGHTIGHAIESYYLDKENSLLHGEAIVIGMIAEAYLSFHYGDLREDSLNEIVSFFKSYYPLMIVEEAGMEEILDYMKMDKKNEGNAVQYVQLKCIGTVSFGHLASREQLREAILYYNSLSDEV